MELAVPLGSFLCWRNWGLRENLSTWCWAGWGRGNVMNMQQPRLPSDSALDLGCRGSLRLAPALSALTVSGLELLSAVRLVRGPKSGTAHVLL